MNDPPPQVVSCEGSPRNNPVNDAHPSYEVVCFGGSVHEYDIVQDPRNINGNSNRDIIHHPCPAYGVDSAPNNEQKA